MSVLSENQIDQLRKEYKGLVGQDVTLIVTGLRVNGTVKAFSEDKNSFRLEVEHEPVNWGGEIYTVAYPFARKFDNWGSMNHVKPIE